MTTVCITPELLEMAADAVKHDRNRQPNDRFFEQLDPDGLHAVDLSFPHQSYHATDQEVRALWACKMKGSTKPAFVWIDCNIDLFNDNTHEVDIDELIAAAKAKQEDDYDPEGVHVI